MTERGAVKIWRCFVEGERYNTYGYEPCYYWGRIELYRKSWLQNGNEVIKERYIVDLDYHKEIDSPYWMRNSVIYNNNGRGDTSKREFNKLQNAKRFIKKHIKSEVRILWECNEIVS